MSFSSMFVEAAAKPILTKPLLLDVTPAGVTVSMLCSSFVCPATFEVQYGAPGLAGGKWRLVAAPDMRTEEEAHDSETPLGIPLATGIVEARKWQATMRIGQDTKKYVVRARARCGDEGVWSKWSDKSDVVEPPPEAVPSTEAAVASPERAAAGGAAAGEPGEAAGSGGPGAADGGGGGGGAAAAAAGLYRVAANAVLRQGWEFDSAVDRQVSTGEVVTIVETREMDTGQLRMRLATGGWMSQTSSDGTVLLERVEQGQPGTEEAQGSVGAASGRIWDVAKQVVTGVTVVSAFRDGVTIMAPLASSPGEIVGSFQEMGPLGIEFEFEDMSIKAILPGYQAERLGNLRLGLVVRSIDGLDPREMSSVEDAKQALTKRPITLVFREPDTEFRHSQENTSEQEQDHEPEVDLPGSRSGLTGSKGGMRRRRRVVNESEDEGEDEDAAEDAAAGPASAYTDPHTGRQRRWVVSTMCSSCAQKVKYRGRPETAANFVTFPAATKRDWLAELPAMDCDPEAVAAASLVQAVADQVGTAAENEALAHRQLVQVLEKAWRANYGLLHPAPTAPRTTLAEEAAVSQPPEEEPLAASTAEDEDTVEEGVPPAPDGSAAASRPPEAQPYAVSESMQQAQLELEESLANFSSQGSTKRSTTATPDTTVEDDDVLSEWLGSSKPDLEPEPEPDLEPEPEAEPEREPEPELEPEPEPVVQPGPEVGEASDDPLDWLGVSFAPAARRSTKLDTFDLEDWLNDAPPQDKTQEVSEPAASAVSAEAPPGGSCLPLDGGHDASVMADDDRHGGHGDDGEDEDQALMSMLLEDDSGMLDTLLDEPSTLDKLLELSAAVAADGGDHSSSLGTPARAGSGRAQPAAVTPDRAAGDVSSGGSGTPTTPRRSVGGGASLDGSGGMPDRVAMTPHFDQSNQLLMEAASMTMTTADTVQKEAIILYIPEKPQPSVTE